MFEVYLPEHACPVKAKVRQAGQEFEMFESLKCLRLQGTGIKFRVLNTLEKKPVLPQYFNF
jgi:hypothetical protein